MKKHALDRRPAESKYSSKTSTINHILKNNVYYHYFYFKLLVRVLQNNVFIYVQIYLIIFANGFANTFNFIIVDPYLYLVPSTNINLILMTPTFKTTSEFQKILLFVKNNTTDYSELADRIALVLVFFVK